MEPRRGQRHHPALPPGVDSEWQPCNQYVRRDKQFKLRGCLDNASISGAVSPFISGSLDGLSERCVLGVTRWHAPFRQRCAHSHEIPGPHQVAGGRLELLEKCAIMCAKGVPVPGGS